MNDSSLPQGTRSTLALSVTGLTKHYDSGFTLDDVTFDLPSGYIMGLVGPNGAGKSTLIKLILNMTTRDAGRIEVLGLDAMADEERAKEQLGVVLDSSYFIEYMTVDAVERTSSPMYPLWDHNLFDAYLRRFGLGRNKKIKDLSRGMQMKLMLAVALSHDAKLLILDEPTSGLDVLSRDELMDILSDYVADGGHSVIFSTHITADLERCADFLAYITNGMLYYSGPKDEFEDAFRLVKGGPDELTDGLQRAMVGIRTYATGFDALVRTQDIPHIGGTDGLLTQHASIEDVIRLTNAAEHTAIGNTNEGDVR
nr:ABC transporter ATP-binding protein [Bifidobacterium catenulatum]